MLEDVTLTYGSIQKLFIGVFRAKFTIPNQSPDKWEKSDKGISDFWISGQPTINKNYQNYDFFDIKL